MVVVIEGRKHCANCRAPEQPGEQLVNDYCTECWLWLLEDVDGDLDSLLVM